MPGGGHLLIETANVILDEKGAASSDGPHTTVPAGEYVTLSVTDTGTGMSPTIMTRVFDPFFTTKPLGQGTGLGLSMIYGFVQQSGGHIHLSSEVGQGTTVTIYLPRHLGAVDGTEVDMVAGLSPKGSAVVLVVEDELPIRMVIADVLSDLGYTVLEAGDGRSALKVLEAGTLIDLLITDVGLPGGTNGRQLADAARQRRPDLQGVLFITGYAESTAVGNGLMEQGMQVMTKPFALEALAAKIQGIVGH